MRGLDASWDSLIPAMEPTSKATGVAYGRPCESRSCDAPYQATTEADWKRSVGMGWSRRQVIAMGRSPVWVV